MVAPMIQAIAARIMGLRREVLCARLFLLRISGVYGDPLALLKRLRCLKAIRKELQQQNADIFSKP